MVAVRDRRSDAFRQPVALIENQQLGNLLEFQSLEHLVDGIDAKLELRISDVRIVYFCDCWATHEKVGQSSAERKLKAIDRLVF